MATIGEANAPTAMPDTFSLEQGSAAAQLDVVANDNNPGGALTITIMQAPQHGTAVAGPNDVTYTPDTSGFFGIDSFTYAITDSDGNRSAATATIFINKPENSSPLSTSFPWERLTAHKVTLPPATPACTITLNDLLAIARDPNADPLVVYSMEAPEIGRLTAAAGGQVQYARDAGRFGSDSFSYTIADANGGFDTGTIVIKQGDSDIDGMPDDWETAHNLNPLAGDAMDDPDEDGLPNLAEYALHTDPQVADNPLNLSALSMTSGYVDVPLNISPEVNPDTPFVVLMDGNEVELGSGVNVLRNPDGTWHLQLNPIFENGEHTLVLGFNFAGEDWMGTWLTAFGSTATMTVNNAFTLDASSCTYEGGVVLSATVNIPATSYTIQIRDSQNNLLTTLSGVTSDGTINASWDGTDGSGHPIASGSLQTTISLAGPSGGGSGSASITPRQSKCGEDVTKLVYATLGDIANAYANAGPVRRKGAIEGMFSSLQHIGGFSGGWAWDIQWLIDFTSENWVSSPQDCKNTVTFEGQCVHIAELNYMMFGIGILLCNHNPSWELGYLWNGLELRSFLTDEDEEVMKRKVGFAAYGAGFYLRCRMAEQSCHRISPRFCNQTTRALARVAPELRD